MRIFSNCTELIQHIWRLVVAVIDRNHAEAQNLQTRYEIDREEYTQLNSLA